MFSSAKPLRAYVADNMLALRFSPKLYDAKNLDDPRMYVTDGVEFGIKAFREVNLIV